METKHWKTPKHIKDLLDEYYMSKYGLDHEEYASEYGPADFAHDESLAIFLISKIENDIFIKIKTMLRK